jgi:hypothetical protein
VSTKDLCINSGEDLEHRKLSLVDLSGTALIHVKGVVGSILNISLIDSLLYKSVRFSSLEEFQFSRRKTINCQRQLLSSSGLLLGTNK